ncbi:MAG: hypothetical protein PHN56_04755 [Candidatus Nanoarchaeia archaeon]|nr:hypothetical protein [Candidatus Nanoarchaeia archaeon]
MLMSKYWAICEVTVYKPFYSPLIPIAYLSQDLCEKLYFLKPNLCQIIIENKYNNEDLIIKQKYDFFVEPSSNQDKIENIFYDNHSISVPLNFYKKFITPKKDLLINVMTNFI